MLPALGEGGHPVFKPRNTVFCLNELWIKYPSDSAYWIGDGGSLKRTRNRW